MNETITWVDVSDRLPDDGKMKIVQTRCAYESIYIAWFLGDKWVDDEYDAVDVLAWADMPKGPATKEQK